MTQHFGNKQLIIVRYIEALLSVEAVTSDFNLKALMKIFLSELQARERADASDTAGKVGEKIVKSHATAAALLTGG